ncbi:MAG: nitroreductase family protein [Acidimicrobiia bacterium]
MRDFYDFILGLRAIRQFQGEPLGKADLDAILEAGRWTGSSKNRQDWVFVVITGERLQGLAEHGDFTTPVRNSAATVVLVQEHGGNLFDIGRAAQNMMLAAKAIGVASCPITLHRSDDARAFIGAPDGSVVRYAVALGYPSQEAAPSQFGGRKELSSVVRQDRY